METCPFCGKEIRYEVEKNQSVVTYCTKCSDNGKYHQTIYEIKNERDALRAKLDALKAEVREVLGGMEKRELSKWPSVCSTCTAKPLCELQEGVESGRFNCALDALKKKARGE